MYFKSKKTAFTLAEILITIGVIGVVAAITIPTLSSNIRDQQFKAMFKKRFAEVSQASMNLATANGGNLKNLAIANWRDTFAYAVSPYIKYQKICAPTYGSQTIVGNCWHSTNTVLRLNGQQGTYSHDFFVHDADNGGLILMDGAYFATSYQDISCQVNGNDCGNGVLDVNGANGPNQQGKDVYGFHIRYDGILVPFKPGENYPYMDTMDCSPSGNGTGCAGTVLMGN